VRTDGRLFWIRATWFLDRIKQGRQCTAGDLAEKFCYHEQSARRTINSLRDDFGAPLEFDPAGGTWVLTDPHWELPRLPLSTGEVVALSLARGLVSHVTAPGIAEDMERFWRKFSQELAEQSPAGAAFADSVSALAPTWAEPDGRVMDLCLRALALERRLHIHYQSPWSASVTERTVEPRHLVLYEGGFYLAAHCLLRGGGLRLFHLSAIRSAHLEPDPVSPLPQRFSLDQVVDSYGLMLGGEPVDVTLRITPPAAARAAVETWHPDQRDERIPHAGVSQRDERIPHAGVSQRDRVGSPHVHSRVSASSLADEGPFTLIRTFPVRGLAEVKRLVLSLGASVEVLAPEALRDEVHAEIEKMRDRNEISHVRLDDAQGEPK